MLESWFFADPEGPANAGVPADRLPPLLAAGDPEKLLVRDESYLGDDASACAAWRELSPKRQAKNRPPWLLERGARERHPKAYLAWLLRQPAERKCSAYREVQGGRSALTAIDWGACLRDSEHCSFLRAMLFDLADALETELPAEFSGVTAAATARNSLPPVPVLRNL